MKKSILTLCGSALLAMTVSSVAFADMPVATTDSSIHFPATNSSYLSQPMRVDVEKLSKIDNGLTKDSVRQLLGNPHFKEFGGNTWNYWLNIQVPDTHEYVECQLRLDYDNKQVGGIYWSNPACADTAQAKKPVVVQQVVVEKPVPVAAPAIPEALKVTNLRTDGLFAFGRSNISDMNPQGIASLNSLVYDLKKNASAINTIDIKAYTDRIGSPSANLVLSQRRAEAVKSFMLSNDLPIDPNAIHAVGMGVSNDTSCSGNQPKKALIDCLAADRKVVVQVN